MAAGAGTYHIFAEYRGDANFNRSFELATQTVNKADTTTRISSSVNPVVPGGEVDFTVDIGVLPPGAVAPFGTLAFTVDGVTVFGPVPVFGANRVVLRATAPGRPSTDTIGALYGGDANTNPSADSLTQVVASPSQPASPIAGAAASSGAATTTASGSPPAGAPATATTANVLERMVDVLSAALRSRGLSALGRTKETITVDASGTLNQTVYSPRAPSSAVATRKTSKNVVIASVQHRFDAPGAAALQLRLTAAGRRAVRRSRSLKLAIVTRFTPRSGTPVVVVNRLTAKAKGGRSAGRAAASARGLRWRVISVR
jgi:hypothetical protein